MPPEFLAAFGNWDREPLAVGLRRQRHWAVSLGATEDPFDAAFADLPATLMKRSGILARQLAAH